MPVMCLWRNVKIDQRAKVYSFFRLVFMMKYSSKVKKQNKTTTQKKKKKKKKSHKKKPTRPSS